MKITDMKITEIEEFVKDEFPETNLYMRCVLCGEYLPLTEFDNFETEECRNCEDETEETEFIEQVIIPALEQGYNQVTIDHETQEMTFEK